MNVLQRRRAGCRLSSARSTGVIEWNPTSSSVKFYVEDDVGHRPRTSSSRCSLAGFRTHAVPDHLLIDVADYAHVPNGPGTVLVAHEANIHIDRTTAGSG